MKHKDTKKTKLKQSLLLGILLVLI